MQVSEEELAEYIASQQQAGHTLPGITLSHSKPQVSRGVSQHNPAALHRSVVLLRSISRYTLTAAYDSKGPHVKYAGHWLHEMSVHLQHWHHCRLNKSTNIGFAALLLNMHVELSLACYEASSQTLGTIKGGCYNLDEASFVW